MTGIDSALASVLASRIDSLIDSVAAGSRTAAAQTGASTQTADMRGTPVGPVPPVDTPPPASAQARLSEVGLTLDAISRFGGEATPPVVGQLPIWPSPPAIDAAPAQVGATGANAAAPGASGTAAGMPSSTPSSNQAAGAGIVGTATAAALLPVAALATALARTVASTGLFYESHLAQWASGAYRSEALIEEPQARLGAQAAQLPLDWTDSAAGVAADAPELGAWLAGRPAAGLPGAPVPVHAQAAQLLASALAGDARANATAYATARQLPDVSLPGQEGADGRTAAGLASHGDAALQAAPSSIAASIHPATIPLVRQQLDLLATDQFRWSGEVWPGAKLDWTIEEERERYDARGGAGSDEFEARTSWRTRLTLALPTLGTVDADLLLTGSQLVVRVQASPAGAARLAVGQTAFGERLEAAGLKLAGLSIREIGGATPAGPGGGGQAATSAYARAAAAAADAQARDVPSDGPGGWSTPAAGEEGTPKRSAPDEPAAARPRTSPLDGLFDDPFEWGGS